MQTNCFEQGPSGLRENSGMSWTPFKEADGKAQERSDGSLSKNKVVGCHVRQFTKSSLTPGSEQETNQWQEKTAW